jgi:hypothetical protein
MKDQHRLSHVPIAVYDRHRKEEFWTGMAAGIVVGASIALILCWMATL